MGTLSYNSEKKTETSLKDVTNPYLSRPFGRKKEEKDGAQGSGAKEPDVQDR